MLLKKIIPILFVLALPLSSCGESGQSSTTTSDSPTTSPTDTGGDITDPTDPTEPIDPSEGSYKEEFDNLVNKIKTEHNYRIEVHSYLPEYIDDPETIYDDFFVNINDKAYYNKFYSAISGKIYQKNQGYINFIYNGEFIENGFYATNYNVGISSLYDLNAENLFIGEYVQDSTNEAIFTSDNDDAIAVASNFTGYIDSSWFVAPEKLIVEVKKDIHQLVFTVNFDTWYIEDGVGRSTEGIAILTIKDIGTSTHQAIESYIENPTITFPTRTSWNDYDKELFDKWYAGTYPTFPANASYALSSDEYLDKRDGKYKVMLTDLNSGDLSSSYGDALISQGFSKTGDIYSKEVINDTLKTKTTYVVEMAFLEPNADYYSRKVKDYYPNGLFQALFKATTVNTSITTVEAFNEYLQINGYNMSVPSLPFNSSTTTISHFYDKTADMNSKYGAGSYIFYTDQTNRIRIHVADYNEAVSDINAYVALLAGKGFDSPSTFFDYINYENKTDFKTDSSVLITDISKFNESTYPGYFEISYKIYAYKDEEDLPILTKIEITTLPTTNFNVGDTFSFEGGKVFATYTTGQYVQIDNSKLEFSGYDMSKSGTQTVTVSYTEGDITVTDTYEIYVASNLTYRCVFTYAALERIAVINLSDDGTGTYSLSYNDHTYSVQISYVISGSTITFTLQSEVSGGGFSDFTRFFLFAGDNPGYTTNTGTINSDGSITVTLNSTNGNNPNERTFTL